MLPIKHEGVIITKMPRPLSCRGPPAPLLGPHKCCWELTLKSTGELNDHGHGQRDEPIATVTPPVASRETCLEEWWQGSSPGKQTAAGQEMPGPLTSKQLRRATLSCKKGSKAAIGLKRPDRSPWGGHWQTPPAGVKHRNQSGKSC